MKKFCYNCGKKGHIYNNCLSPIMSYGGILYRIKDQNKPDSGSNSIEPEYLMVQRTYTPDFKEIIRGKFALDDVEYIKKLVHRLTLQEIDYVFSYSHQILYRNIQRYCRVKKNPQK